jgi:major membrane immunogen (membrane-anchored lipoprotein)
VKRNSITAVLLASMLALPLVACSSSDRDDAGSAANGLAQAKKEIDEKTSPSFIAAQVQQGIEQAKLELATKDIDVNGVHVGEDHQGKDRNNLPKAVITPQGDLVIAGKTVKATPEQHTLLLDYRQHIIHIAEAGMDIGASGASLGTAAAKEAIWGALSGKSDKEIEDSLKPQTEQIKAAAVKLCRRMPDLLASQQKLAAAVPEFRPYATMTQKDVDDCGKDADKN